MAERRSTVAEELLEPIQIDLIRVEPDEVAGTLSDEDLARRAEQLAQLRHVDLDRVRGRRRRVFTPELVDQAVGRDDLIRVEDQDHKQRSRLRAAELERPPVGDNLERSEHAEVQTGVAEVLERSVMRAAR